MGLARETIDDIMILTKIKNKRLVFSAMLPLLSILMVFAVFEILLRYENYYTRPKLRKIDIPNYGSSIFIDREGIQVIEGQKVDKKNILLVGDSFTAGNVCAAKSEDFPGQIQKNWESNTMLSILEYLAQIY